jgi:site-specific DNA recombinase
LTKAKAGRERLNGGAPFGYDVIDGKLIPNETERSTLDLIKRHRRAGKSCNAIAKYLNDHGIKTKFGRSWHSKTVRRCLDADTDLMEDS